MAVWSEKGEIMRKSPLSGVLALLIVLALLSLPVSAGATTPKAAAEEPSIVGHWVGEVEVPGTKLGVDIDFTLKADGAGAGDISVPMQNAKDLPLGNITAKGKDVFFEISGVPGSPAFKGTLSDDGQKISGQFP